MCMCKKAFVCGSAHLVHSFGFEAELRIVRRTSYKRTNGTRSALKDPIELRYL